jgi:hypothetical protein
LQRRREPFSPEHPAYAALLAHQQRSSRELAAAVLDALSRTLHPGSSYPPPHARELLRHIARSAPPEDGPALVAGLSAQGEAELSPALRKEADDMLLVLDFRRRMLAALPEL